MAIWRLVRHFTWRSKSALAWIWFSLVLLALFAQSPASWASSAVFDAARACLSFVPFFSRLLGREVAVLPVGRRDVWRAKWLLATIGVALLTSSARFFAFYVPSVLVRLRPTAPLVTLGLVDLLEAGTIAACVAMLIGRRPFGRAQAAFRAQRWLAGLTLISAPWWGHLIDNQVMANGGAWTTGTIGLVLLGVGMTLVSAADPHVAYVGRVVDVEVDRSNVVPRAIDGRIRRGPRGAGALRFVGREVLRTAGKSAAALVAIGLVEHLISGRWIGGRPDSPDFLPALAIVLATSMPVSQRARLLRTLPISTGLLVVLPTVLVGMAWITAVALFVGFYRAALGVWPPSPYALTVIEMVALTSVVKSFSLPWSMRGLVPIMAVGPLFAVAVLLPPLDGHVAAAVVVSAVAIAGTIAADHYTFTRSKRVYERPRSLWG